MSNTRKSFRKLALVNNVSSTSAPSINLLANSALANSYNLTLPSTVPALPGQSLISDTSGNLSWGSTTASVSTFTGTTNPLTTATNVTGLLFTATSSMISVYVAINATTNVYSLYNLKVYQKGSSSSWGLAYDVICDTDDVDPQVLFTVTSTGQIQYTLPNTIAGFTSIVMMWSLGTSVSNTLASLALTSTLNVGGASTFTAGIQGTSLALSSTFNVAGLASFTAGMQGTSLALSSTFNVVGLATHAAMTGLSLVLGNAIGSGVVSSTVGTFLNVQPQTYTDTGTAASSTAAGSFSASYLGTPTLAATNTAVTTPIASTLTIAGPPVAGTNETISNAYALNVQNGASNFNGAVTFNGGNGFTLYANAITSQPVPQLRASGGFYYGSSLVISATYNVASIVRNSTGNFTVNFVKVINNYTVTTGFCRAGTSDFINVYSASSTSVYLEFWSGGVVKDPGNYPGIMFTIFA